MSRGLLMYMDDDVEVLEEFENVSRVRAERLPKVDDTQKLMMHRS